MSTPTSNRYAVVADGRSLMRDLLRFLLEQEGFSVASEATTAAAAVEAVTEHHPDVVIVHEATAQDDPEAIERIRREVPDATLVILAADRSATPPALTAAADAVVEEGAGLQDLASVLSAGAGVTVSRWMPRPGPRPKASEVRGQRWVDRIQGAVAASILLLTVVIATSVQPSAPVELRAAYESLEVLAEELPEASVQEAVMMATTLISERAMLWASSVDVSALDVEIAETIGPMLPLLSPDVARALREVLGDLLTAVQSPTPTPTISPLPEPTETQGLPEPDPSATEPTAPETESPAPENESPSPSPTQTETVSPSPSPSESPSPSPSSSPSPSPTPSESPSLTPSETPSPSSSPTGSPSPSPSESPSPSPSSSPSESPSPTPSESPSPMETPSPTESPSPSAPPSHSESPSTTPPEPPPTDSPTAVVETRATRGGNGAIMAVPPSLVILLGSSGAARWLRRRRR